MKKNSKEQVVVTVPVYKADICDEEKDSLLQLFKILGHYPICFFTHNSLDLSIYEHLLAGKEYTVTYFDEKYFRNLDGYNRLLLSKMFYERFISYKYLLIYQLDAWVFSDDLSFWCGQDYDYIGAPWFEDFKEAALDSPFVGVGNGGFSLRKISSHLRALKSFSYIRPVAEIWGEYSETAKTFKSFKQLLKNLTVKNNTFHRFNNYNKNEDAFWGIVVKGNFKWFKFPDMITAAKFSFEVNASKLYSLNNNKLPFGCHALLKYDADFFYKIREI